MRKIIQIAVTSASEVIDSETLYALCDDGSVWFRALEVYQGRMQAHWLAVKDVPQATNLYDYKSEVDSD